MRGMLKSMHVIGAHGSVAIGKKLLWARMLSFFARTSIDWQRRVGERFSIDLAYNYYLMKLESSENDHTGSLQIRHSGPALFVSAGF